MTTLVTGAGGFLGGHIVRQLLAAGEPVRGLDLAFPEEFPDAAEAVIGSILEAEDIAAAMQNVTHIVHAAAVAHLWVPDRSSYDRVNALGTSRVLAAAGRAEAKTVLVSSFTTLVAQTTAPGTVLDETFEYAPTLLLGDYPRTKRQAEILAQSAVDAGQPVTIVQPAAPIGAGDYNLTPPTEMIRDLATGKVPALLNCSLNLVDAVAVAKAIIAARAVGVAGERYLLAGQDISLPNFAAMVAGMTEASVPHGRVPVWLALAAAQVEAGVSRITKRPPKAPLTGVRMAQKSCRFDSSKAKSTLGFAPRPLEECLAECLNWLRQSGHI
ncbi:MAG: NAD-dependent epimerase/dehydratase family protein [Pseudomonadota bacterium]